jgi:NAD(P) transhydrogenase
MRYDLVVIGSGPAGQKAAIAAAKQNWRVAIVERQRELLGGVSLHTGTIPSKTIREAILHLTGYRHRDVYEDTYRRKREITMNDLRRKVVKVAQTDWQVIQDQFARNRVTVACGEASFSILTTLKSTAASKANPSRRVTSCWRRAPALPARRTSRLTGKPFSIPTKSSISRRCRAR